MVTDRDKELMKAVQNDLTQWMQDRANTLVAEQGCDNVQATNIVMATVAGFGRALWERAAIKI